MKNLSYHVNETAILENVNLFFNKKSVTAIIGPSGSGKTTLLRCFNRMNDLTPGGKLKGKVNFKGKDITNGIDVYRLRSQVGMVFQKPTIFPKSIYENVIFGLDAQAGRGKRRNKCRYSETVEKNLREVYLWDEVKDKLDKTATSLSHGQQQRLCMARTLALSPEVILLDEPTSALDPKSTEAIEMLIRKLKGKCSVVLITHNLAQARRVADHVVFICDGKVCETGPVEQFFSNPCEEKTRNYIGA